MGGDGDPGECKRDEELTQQTTHAEDVVDQKAKKSRDVQGGNEEDELPTSPDKEVIPISSR